MKLLSILSLIGVMKGFIFSLLICSLSSIFLNKFIYLFSNGQKIKERERERVREGEKERKTEKKRESSKCYIIEVNEEE